MKQGVLTHFLLPLPSQKLVFTLFLSRQLCQSAQDKMSDETRYLLVCVA